MRIAQDLTRPPYPEDLPEVLVFMKRGIDAAAFAREYGLRVVRALRSDPDAHLLAAADVPAARAAAGKAASDARVRYAYVNQRVYRVKCPFVPNDPYYNNDNNPVGFPGQWHLGNGYSTIHVNAVAAWNRDITGTGVTIGIVDDGLPTTHPDLAPGYSAADSWDFGGNDPVPNPVRNSDNHGTAVSGVAAARGGNGIGVTGAAPLAGLAGLRIDFDPQAQTAADFADATLYHSSAGSLPLNIKVKNHSYGYTAPYIPTTLERQAAADSALAGTIHCFAAGNERGAAGEDSNKQHVQSSPDVIAVAALGSNGLFASYSSFGANVLVTAPSSSSSPPGLLRITTTDRVGNSGYNSPSSDPFPDADYTSTFGGTSSASPLVAGVMALAKEVQPALNVRFAKHLAARTSVKVNPADASATSDGGWKTNGANLSFNQNYGFGLIDADALCQQAVLYSGVTPLATQSTGTVSVSQAIPDNNPTGVSRPFVLGSGAPLEEVLVTLNITHTFRGDIEAYLTSPSNTQGRLCYRSTSDSGDNINWTFATHAFWGEDPAGTWTLNVRDVFALDLGTWTSYVVTARMGQLIGDSTAPTVASIVRTGTSPTNASSVDFTVTFSETVTGVNAADFALTATGPLSGASVSSVTGNGSAYTVTVNTGSGDGTIRLDLLDDDSIRDFAGNRLGGIGAGNGNFTTGQVYTIDKTPPGIFQVTSTTGNGVYGLAAPINITVDFTEPVTLAGGNLNVTLSTADVISIPSFGPAGSASATYTVGPGDNSPDLDSLSLALSGGTLRDAVGNNAILTTPPGQNLAALHAIVVDTAPPATPAAPDLAAASDTGSSSADNITRLTTPAFQGVTEPNAVVTLFVGGSPVGSTAADGSGNYGVAPSSPLGEGVFSFTVTARDAVLNTSAASPPLSVTIDVTGPSSTVAGPASPTNLNPVSFTITFAEPVTGFTGAEVLVSNGVSGALVGSGASYTLPVTPSAQGLVTCQVPAGSAQDTAGNDNAASNLVSILFDSLPPDASIASGPPALSTSTSAAFDFTSTEPGTFEASLDGGGYVTVSDPATYLGLPQGAHSLQVRARDAAGNVDPTPATWNWAVDSLPPQTTIDSGPSGAVSSTSATFTFSSSEGGSTFEASLDGAVFGAATSPVNLAGLPQGSHTFQVRATDPAGNLDLSPATRTWTVDTVPPDTFILSGPPAQWNSTTATFDLSSNESGVAFQASLDGAGFSPITDPAVLSSLGQGLHTLSVIAVDAAGNPDSTPATWAWTVDTVPPDTTITLAPSNPSTADVNFTFTSTEGSTFQCRLDVEPWQPNSTGTVSYAGLPNGSHTFEVKAVDAAGNEDLSPASHTWTVDSVAPNTTLTGTPPALSASTDATFTFVSSESPSTFLVNLDLAGWVPNSTGTVSYSGLPQGSHNFQVKAVDSGNNEDPSPATYTWTVDTVAPETTIDSGPSGTVSSRDATFTFSSIDPGATFQANLDGAGFVAATSPRSYTNLPDGPHTFEVRAVDALGNVDASPAMRTWTIDATPPETMIDSGPSGTVSSRDATFTFSSNDSGATFQAQLDGSGFAAATSPFSYTNLPDGPHTFEVRAVDALGNMDATPATRTWTIDATPPETTLDSGPSGTVSSRDATFTFSSNDPGATFQARLDGSGFAAATSPFSYTNLPDGPHTFEVRAVDGVGNADPTPATRTWTVDATPPETTILSEPPAMTNQTSAPFDFDSNEPGVTFEARLDGSGAFGSVSDPALFTGLAEGVHLLEVRARDGAGNVDASPAAYSWTVDLSAPETALSGFPASVTNSPDATFDFSSEPGARFEVRLDGPTWTDNGTVTSVAFAGLADGAHTFEVRAVDPAGNADPTPAVYSWTIDTAPPDTTLTTTPAALSNSSQASFAFSSSQGGGTFRVRLDGGAWQDIGTAATIGFTGLADGPHTFDAAAVDAAGNEDASPASHAWTVDTTAPDTLITDGPPDPSNTSSAAFTFVATETGSTFEVRLDGGGWSPDATGAANYSGLANGPHTFEARAIDPAGNTDGTPASRTWTVAVPTPPAITSSPVTTATAGVVYLYDAEATGLPAPTFSLSAAPPGMTIQAATGLVRWVPTQAQIGVHPVTVVATNGVPLDASQAFSVTVSANAAGEPPIAVLPADQTGPPGGYVLDGSGSSDPEGGTLTFLWSESPGNPSLNRLTSPGSAVATFAGAAAGLYTFTLQVTDPDGLIAEGSASVTIVDIAPTADAGSDLVVLEGQSVTLDGRGSSDPNGSSLGFTWTEAPGNPSAGVLSGAGTATPAFQAAVPGTYRMTLQVSDGIFAAADSVRVDVVRLAGPPVVPPTADAGVDRIVFLPSPPIVLSGSASVDPDDPSGVLSYAWFEDLANPSPGTLSGSAVESPSFTPGLPGRYVFTLVVVDAADDNLLSAPDSVAVWVNPAGNAHPSAAIATTFADADGDGRIDPGEWVTLSGAGSSDPESAPLTFLWTQAAGPAVRAGASGDSLAFAAAFAGTYEFELVVSDGTLSSPPATVRVQVVSSGAAPVAAARANGVAGLLRTRYLPGDPPIALDGTASQDLDGDALPLAFRWTALEGPMAPLSGPDTATPLFTPLVAGAYVFHLHVRDSNGLWDTSDVTVVVDTYDALLNPQGNDVPTAVLAPVADVPGGTPVTLDGTASFDPVDSDSVTDASNGLQFHWKQLQGAPVDLDTSVPGLLALVPVVPGTYAFTLFVSDGERRSAGASRSFNVTAPGPALVSGGGGGGGRCGATGLEALVLLGLVGRARRRRCEQY